MNCPQDRHIKAMEAEIKLVILKTSRLEKVYLKQSTYKKIYNKDQPDE